MMRRATLIALAVCLFGAVGGCQLGKKDEGTSSKQVVRRPESLLPSYNARKTKEYVRATKGEGEGAKVKVYVGPSTKETVIGQLNYGTFLELIKEQNGWYAVRYYNPDGGEFFGWIEITKARYIGTQDRANEAISFEDEYRKKNLSLQESDEELATILAVPYRMENRGAEREPRKRFWGGQGPEGTDTLWLLARDTVTSESKAWAAQCQAKLREFSRRSHPDYVPILRAYYDALHWYVAGNKSQFTQMLGQADQKRNEYTRHFGR